MIHILLMYFFKVKKLRVQFWIVKTVLKHTQVKYKKHVSHVTEILMKTLIPIFMFLLLIISRLMSRLHNFFLKNLIFKWFSVYMNKFLGTNELMNTVVFP